MKKFLSSVLVFIVVLANFTLYSNAANAGIKLATSSTSVSVGKEFEVILSLTSLGPFTNGINSVGGNLVYDSNYISYVSMSGKDSWQISQFNQSNGKFLALTANMDLVQTGNILGIKFKLNSLPPSGTKLVTLNGVSITDGDTDEIEFDPVSITITTSVPNTNNTVNNTTTNNTTTNNTTTNNTTTNNTTTNNTTTNNTTTNNTTTNNTTTNNTTTNNTTTNNTTTNNTTVDNTTTNNTTTNIVLDSGNNSGNNSKNNVVVNDSTTTTKLIPYTGFNTFIISAIVVSIILGIYAYCRYKRLNI